MLHIITGRTGSGKTRKVRELIADVARNFAGRSVIIVPEQFSFETEKAMLTLLGNEKANNTEVLSFSRLAEKLLDKNGKLPKKAIDDSTRCVIMSMAVEAQLGKTVSFRRYIKNPVLVSRLVAFRKELKKCKITPEALKNVSGVVRRASFSLKLSELSEIYTLYDLLVGESFGDDTNYLDLLADVLETDDFFRGMTVAVDGFAGFSAQEYSVLEKIMQQADGLYVTFCYDTDSRNDRYDVFRNVYDEIRRLTGFAARAGCKISPRENLVASEEYKAKELNFLEKNIFTNSSEIFEDDAPSVCLMPCKNRKDECDAVAAEIRRLVRTENYRYRDVAVIERSEGTYKNDLANSFRKYGIDCFFDARQSVLSQPLIVFIRNLFDIIIKGFSNVSVLSLLKTGLLSFSTEEICRLEDYVIMWNIKGSQWKEEWTYNPGGYGVNFDENAQLQLEEINRVREKIVGPLLSLKAKIANSTGRVIAEETFNFLRRSGVPDNLKAIAQKLQNSGDSELSLEQGTIWKMTADIFDTLNFAVGDKTVTVERFSELFDILVSTKDVGVIPNSVDEVIVGSADRIRACAPKAVFVVGANAGVFPGESNPGVLLTDRERRELQDSGVDLISNMEYNSVSEMFIAYRALTLSTHRLYVSYSAFGADGGTLLKSEIVTEIEKLFPNCEVKAFDSLSRIESDASAFSVLAKESVNGSVLASSLYDYFKENGEDGKIKMIDKIRKKNFALTDRKTAEKLFGENMYLTASRTEKYYNCPFSYFCGYGIKAKPKKAAEIDAAQTGTLVHFVLETILRDYSKEQFTSLTLQNAQDITFGIIDSYVEEQMSGYENKEADFLRLIALIKERSLKIVLRLIEEFKNCDFVPVSFELNIDRDGDIPPYKLELQGGNSISVRGKVDRVDAWQEGENNFIRVIDYKTGGKDFKLYEVLEGINMQMLIYLFAIWQNGGEKFGNVVPAGVLYFPAKANRISAAKAGRYDGEASLRKAEKDAYSMKGMVLNNVGVITAMEHGTGGVLIPSKIDAKGNVSGNVISLESLYKLKNYVDNEIKNMAYSLYDGKIEAFPTEKACDYCDFKSVCRRESDGEIHELKKCSFDDALKVIGGGADEQ